MVRAQMRNLLAMPGAVLTVAAAAVVLGPAAADAAPAATTADRYCAVLVGKASGGNASPVRARACDGTSPAAARAKMLRAASGNGPKAATALPADLLMTWYVNTDYGGGSTTIYGDDGPCDNAGYRLSTANSALGIWGVLLSSAKGAGPCNTARFSNRAGTYSRTFGLPVPYLGSLLNDNVGTIWVYNA